jgi:hypothetical protein
MMTFLNHKFRHLVCWDGKGEQEGLVKNKQCSFKYIVSLIFIAMKILNTK